MRTPHFDFVGRRKQWAILSGILVLVSVVSLFTRGLNLSIDFVGGSSFLVENLTTQVNPQQLRQAVEDTGVVSDVTAQVRGQGDNEGALVRTNALEPGGDAATKVKDAITQATGADKVQVNFVGPTWGTRISRKAIEALIVFLILVSLYISFRLEFKMAVTGVVALIHDILITIGVYSISGFTVSPSTVIALLTILGYSLYDTVVVFDRVKESRPQLGRMGRRTYGELVNTSMNEVFVRSMNTSVTSLLPVGSLLFIGSRLLGASTLQDLALALFVGMALGAYSSLFVAGPLFAWWKEQEPEHARRARKLAEKVEAGEEPELTAEHLNTQADTPITTDYVRGPGRKRRGKRG